MEVEMKRIAILLFAVLLLCGCRHAIVSATRESTYSVPEGKTVVFIELEELRTMDSAQNNTLIRLALQNKGYSVTTDEMASDLIFQCEYYGRKNHPGYVLARFIDTMTGEIYIETRAKSKGHSYPEMTSNAIAKALEIFPAVK